MRTPALVAAVLALAGAATVSAQRAAGDADVLRASVTIQAIDAEHRMVTFRDESGYEDTVQIGPEMKRFSELKVGDRVNFAYYQSRIIELKKRGSSTGAVGTTGTDIVRSEGALPAAAEGRQTTAVVTVISTNLDKGEIGIRTDDGRVFRRQLQDKSLLKDVVADDKVELTFTQAVLVEIDRPQ